jgi:lactoylglutathione lyase
MPRHAQLSGRGVDVDELLHWEGVPPMFDFRDPDGNVLYVSESPAPTGLAPRWQLRWTCR